MTNNKILLSAVLSVAAFPAWAQDNNSPQDASDNLVVTANRFPQPVSSVLAPMDIVTRDDIERWQAKSLTDVMRRLPGVDIAQNGGRGQNASMFIRGTNSSHVLVLIDGIRMASPGVTGSVDFNQIPMSLVQRIEYIRGQRSAVYGPEAIGGVINIITQQGTDGGKLEAGVGSNKYQIYDGSLRQHISDNTAISLAGSFEETQGFNVYSTSSAPADNDNDGFRSKALWGSIEQKFNDSVSGFVRSYGYGNKTDYDQLSAGFSDQRQLYSRNFDGGLRFQNNDLASQLIGSYQTYKDYNFESAKGNFVPGYSLNEVTQRSLLWGNTLAIINGSISAGVDWRREENKPGTSNQRHMRENTGLYLTAQQQYFEQVTLEGAIRTDDSSQYNRHNTWQAAAGWTFIPDYRVIISYGTAFLAPAFGQIYGTWGNDSIKAEESSQWEAGLEGLTGPLSWRLSAYRNKIDNLIDYDYVTNKYFNTDKATIKGVEWTGNIDTGIFSHRLTLEYLDPRRDSDNTILARRSKQKASYQIDWSLFDIDMNIAYQYNGKRYDNSPNMFNSQQRRLPSYSTVDLAASYPVIPHLTVRGRIANLFDKDYETAYGYRTAGREYYLTGSYIF
ncbi:vitamin B12 transporter|uniref:Vitamin B12 transporter BtuB n=1 Tax=Brenneria salicis ATCC 15712 = DSM 30166 TaxID=714314 RepID=A0A366I7B6_9GAMM|nr:TonB-dependent vitamin B12 receptor BtuB [Brenneria salicis]NMN93183.1 vitamin B12 transporter [Brenneria salicis ATCC 15712 = DSM 30166]RBP64044.1 vitamin B12 transporter [Brenneria salicis ATCC 15712 = DSM 30166]RLM31078.1 TonB-dependent vitamin B12 receptor [Brenneria salicis ATCC 15712 = DSM 30166]